MSATTRPLTSVDWLAQTIRGSLATRTTAELREIRARMLDGGHRDNLVVDLVEAEIERRKAILRAAEAWVDRAHENGIVGAHVWDGRAAEAERTLTALVNGEETRP